MNVFWSTGTKEAIAWLCPSHYKLQELIILSRATAYHLARRGLIGRPRARNVARAIFCPVFHHGTLHAWHINLEFPL